MEDKQYTKTEGVLSVQTIPTVKATAHIVHITTMTHHQSTESTAVVLLFGAGHTHVLPIIYFYFFTKLQNLDETTCISAQE